MIVWRALLYDPHPRGAWLQRLRGQVRQRKEIDITLQANIYLNAKKPDDFELHQVLRLYLQGREGWVRRHLSNRARDCLSCPYVDKAVIKAKLEEQYPTDKWEHSYISESGGYVVTERQHINEGKQNSRERAIFDKEQSMCKVLAEHGHHVSHLRGTNGERDSYDILLDGISADLKSFHRTGGLIKQVKHAY